MNSGNGTPNRSTGADLFIPTSKQPRGVLKPVFKTAQISSGRSTWQEAKQLREFGSRPTGSHKPISQDGAPISRGKNSGQIVQNARPEPEVTAFDQSKRPRIVLQLLTAVNEKIRGPRPYSPHHREYRHPSVTSTEPPSFTPFSGMVIADC